MAFFKKVAKMVGMSSASSVIKKVVSTVAKATSNKKANTVSGRPLARFIPQDKFKLVNSSDVKKFENPEFENYSRKFSNSEPDILFVAEYILDDKSIGSLLVWERFLDATHYEVFKRNIFQEESKFERVLFLDSQSLDEETAHYMNYLKETVGLDVEEDKIFVILDTNVKEDRIYEYKIKAARVPKKPTEVDYDFILESKGLTKQVVVDKTNKNTVFSFAGTTLGSRALAWTIAILNEKVPFFGRGALEKSLIDLQLDLNSDKEEFVLLANDTNNIMAVINDSMSLFGAKETFRHLLRVLGGLGSDFRETYISSIDETRNVFSYDNYRETIKKKVPAFSLILQIAESGNTAALFELSKLSIVVPRNTGSETFSSIENVTKTINFVNDIFISVLYSQDNVVEVKEILEKIKSGELKSNPISDAAAKSISSPSTKTSASGTSSSTKITTQGSSAAVGAPTSSSSKTSSDATGTGSSKASPAAAAQAAKNAASNAAFQRNQQQNAANKAKSKAAKEKANKEKEDRNKKVKIYF